MKKAIIKGAVFGTVFFIAVFVFSLILNRGNADLTTEMGKAQFPVIYMALDGVPYNELHGYAQPMDPAYMRETITVLDANRTCGFSIDTYGKTINKLSFEVRSVDGERLVESTEVTEFTKTPAGVSGNITVKDLIEENTEYEMVFILSTSTGDTVRYYTRLIWADNYHAAEKLDFVRNFNEKTFDKEACKDLAKYMEPNSEGDNSTLHHVDIHCSLNQVSWGNLEVQKWNEPVFDITEIAEQTATIRGQYIVATGTGKERRFFYVDEYYRLRYTTDRMYLLDFVRNMNSILDEEDDIYVNDKIMIGVADENLPIYESEDGNIFAFTVQNRLYSYNVTTNKLAVVFGFYEDEYLDARNMYDRHGIRVLNVDEAGNMQFVVYGYMNRGEREGQVGIQIYNYDSTFNTIEEMLYVPYDRNFQFLQAEIDQLIYMNGEGYLYLYIRNTVYEINLTDMTYTEMIEEVRDGSTWVSESNRILVWQNGKDLYRTRQLILMDLASRKTVAIDAGSGEYILPLGFMGEDLIYGIAKEEDLTVDAMGRTVFPMYVVRICNTNGVALKNYQQENVYVVDCEIEDNQINLERVTRSENGKYSATIPDHIMNSEEEVVGKNRIATVITENYGKFVQISVKKNIDRKGIQILTPKQVLYEGAREIRLEREAWETGFYAYMPDGSIKIFRNPSGAVQYAEKEAGVVIDNKGAYVWMRGNLATRNQIMAIEGKKANEEQSSLAVCLETMLAYEGINRNTESLLLSGDSVYSILQGNLGNATVLDLNGCSLSSVLYYVNRDIPVLACLNDGNAVLLVGFNQQNVVIMNPEKGTVYKMGMKDATEWLEKNGNAFVTYIR